MPESAIGSPSTIGERLPLEPGDGPGPTLPAMSPLTRWASGVFALIGATVVLVGCSTPASGTTASKRPTTIYKGSQGGIGITPSTTARAGTSSSSGSTSVVTDQPTGATSIRLSRSDLSLISAAYQNFSRFPCAVTPVDGTLKAAIVQATGSDWAIATMQPAAGCTLNDASGEKVDPNRAFPGGPEKSAVFEKKPGGSWQMNWFETEPFPCPPNLPSQSLPPALTVPISRQPS